MSADPAKPSKAKRQADMALVASYHEARLADLLERVRDGFERYDSGELDAFEGRTDPPLQEGSAATRNAAVAEGWPRGWRTQSRHIGRATGNHGRSSPSCSNRPICCESLSSDDPACPPVPCSELMKEILGKLMGL